MVLRDIVLMILIL